MNEFRPGLIERWSGKALRWLMGWLFVIGGVFIGAMTYWLILNPTPSLQLVWYYLVFAALMAPYIVIRYRDPSSTTIPLASKFGRAS